MLTAAIRSSHVFVRLAGLSGKVIIFDEVHSYDVHMSMLLDRLLWWLGALRVPVILLSATLSSGKQRRLVDSWQAGARGRDPGRGASRSAWIHRVSPGNLDRQFRRRVRGAGRGGIAAES